jgi:hypothetical protein
MISTDFYETRYFVVKFSSGCLLKNLGPETFKYRSLFVIIYCRLIASFYEAAVLRLRFFIYTDLYRKDQIRYGVRDKHPGFTAVLILILNLMIKMKIETQKKVWVRFLNIGNFGLGLGIGTI